MSNVELSYDHYIVIKDNVVTGSSLPSNVSFNENTLTFEIGAPISLHVILIYENTKIHYDFKDHVHAEIIESRACHAGGRLEREISLGKDAHVNMFNEIVSDENNELQFIDEGSLDENALLQIGYNELSDNIIDGQYHFKLTGEGAQAKVRMAMLSRKDEKKHYCVHIEHLARHTTGIMDNYGVVKDEARLTVDGIGTINKGYNGSTAHQTNKIIVFDEKCQASANPYLYIDEYDVTASHAAAVGKMDEDHLYYLQTRGLTKRQAMQLITYGYLEPVIHVVDNEMLQERFQEALAKVGA